MSKIRSFSVFVCVLLAASAWGAGFQDDFNRPNGAVGNGWTIQTNGTIKVEIVDNEVLVAGTQATDWVRCGVSRPVTGETRVSFDFKADASFNVHVQVGAADSSAFVEVYAYPGGPMTYANSADGSWPGFEEEKYNGPVRCYSTAFACISLEVYMHYLPAYQPSGE